MRLSADRPQGCVQQRITTPGLKRLQGPRASVSGSNWSHPLYESTIALSRTTWLLHQSSPCMRPLLPGQDHILVYHSSSAIMYKHLSNDNTKGRQIVRTVVPITPAAILLNVLSSTCTLSALPSFPSFPGSEGAATQYQWAPKKLPSKPFAQNPRPTCCRTY